MAGGSSLMQKKKYLDPLRKNCKCKGCSYCLLKGEDCTGCEQCGSPVLTVIPCYMICNEK
jgi:hypothetical protein